jgi:hypothetical protein
MNFSTTVVIVCAALALGDAAPASCGANRRTPPRDANAATATPAATPTPAPATGEPAPQRPAEGGGMRVLAEGQYGKVEEPFLVVAREATVYAELRTLVEGLPEPAADFFERHAVVAAFAGTRNTGGHGVEIRRGADKRVVVEEKAPPPGAITTMALTQPFKVVAVEAHEEESVDVDFGASRSATRWRAYNVTSGEFTTGGGFAGRYENLKLAGTLRIARLGKLLTLAADLKGEGGTKPRALRGVATGFARDAAGFEIPHLDPGTLVDRPRPAQLVKGKFADDARQLSLTFEPLPTNVNDGFEGRGKLEAKATGPAQPKN